MSTGISRDNELLISAVAEIDGYDMAKEVEAKIAEHIQESGQHQYDGFASGVELKEVDTENGTAKYMVEINFTDYGEVDFGSPSSDYYDPPDYGEITLDDVRTVLDEMNDFVEKAFEDLGISAESEEMDYEIEDPEDIFERMLEEYEDAREEAREIRMYGYDD